MRGLLANGNGFGEVVFAAGTGADAEEQITKRTREVAAQLSERARKETRLLPFPTCVARCSLLPPSGIYCFLLYILEQLLFEGMW